MRKTILTICVFGLSLATMAQSTDRLPKGATEVSPGMYKVVDKDGKVSMYRKTPFGVQKLSEDAAKAAEKGESATPPPDGSKRMTPFGVTSTADHAPASPGASPFGQSKSVVSVQTKVTEDGDTLRFERPTPFGVTRWTRKKS